VPFKEAAQLKEYKRKYYLGHKATFLARNKPAQQRKQEFINRRKTKPCLDCGVQYASWVMQFDHRDPKQKKFSIAENKNRFSYQVIEQEIAKCDVVCANCHAERTHKQWIKE
jgi:hypothetical protein